jgi:hypothetical protein
MIDRIVTASLDQAKGSGFGKKSTSLPLPARF